MAATISREELKDKPDRGGDFTRRDPIREEVERGPYWYFHYRQGGRQRTLYIGKTENPEAKVDEIMEGE